MHILDQQPIDLQFDLFQILDQILEIPTLLFIPDELTVKFLQRQFFIGFFL
jgi:hypothetical protein